MLKIISKTGHAFYNMNVQLESFGCPDSRTAICLKRWRTFICERCWEVFHGVKKMTANLWALTQVSCDVVSGNPLGWEQTALLDTRAKHLILNWATGKSPRVSLNSSSSIWFMFSLFSLFIMFLFFLYSLFKKIWNRVDCQRSEKRPKTHKRLKRMLFNWTKQDKTCNFSRESSFSSYVQHKKAKSFNFFLLFLGCT